MSIFASKSAFVVLGLEAVVPSAAHMYQDCSICKDPLDVNIHTTATEKHHSAVRIGSCGHMHGQECLAAWLDAGNSCPTCKRLLFENSGRGVSKSDIRSVVDSLRHMYGERRIMSAVTRIVGKQELEQVQLRRTHAEEQKKIKAEEAQAYREEIMSDDEWMNSGDEDGLSEYEDDGEDEVSDFDMDEEEDGCEATLDEDIEPQSAAS